MEYTSYAVLNISSSDSHSIPDVAIRFQGDYLACRKFIAQEWAQVGEEARINLDSRGGPYELGYLEVRVSHIVEQYIITPA